MANEWFNQDYYVSQKVAQMNATNYKGQSDWTPETATAELGNFTGPNGQPLTWLENFTACNRDGYVSSITQADINVSPNELFNPGEYAQALADYNNAHSVLGKTDWTASSVISTVLSSQHSSLWDHYTNTGAALGINPSNLFDTSTWVDQQTAATGQTAEALLASLKAAGQNPVMAYLDGGGAVADAPAVPADELVSVPDGFDVWAVPGGNEPDNPDVPTGPGGIVYAEPPIYLSEKLDHATGIAGENNLFLAPEFDGVNTLQTGDIVNGNGGQNMLYADLTAGSSFGQILNAVRPTINDVQVIKFSSEQATDNYFGTQATASVRADRINDAMNELWSSNSRATLEVNDVRVDSNTVTVGFQNADNSFAYGNDMDLLVRYNNQWLKADDSATAGTLTLELIDTTGAMAGQPLLNNAYDGFNFFLNGVAVHLNIGTVSGPEATYADLLTAIQNALAANPSTAGVVTAAFGNQFTMFDGNTGTPVQGSSIVLHSINGALTVPEADAWTTSTGLPPTNSLSATVEYENSDDCPLIETKIALDNAGMVEWNDISTCIPNNQQFGDYAGDVMVGGQGNGDYVGVQRFDVTVDRGSWIKSLQSTNNALRLITVKSGDLNDDGTVGTLPMDKGNLFIGEGQRLTNHAVRGGNLMFDGWDGTNRDGMLGKAGYINPDNVWWTDYSVPVGMTIQSGIVDVKNFDATGMTGGAEAAQADATGVARANISAAITSFASRKYLGDTDQVDGLGNRFAPGGNFEYKFGSGDDTLNMSVNGQVAGDNDFAMLIDMGDGNNNVHTQFDTEEGSTSNWLLNQWNTRHPLQPNMQIGTGSGNDIVNPWGNGRTVVNTGAGDDVVYADQSGLVYQWVEKGGATPPADPPVAKTYEGHIDGIGAIFVLNANPAVATPTDTNPNPLAVKVDANGYIVPVRNDILAPTNSNFSTIDLQLANGNLVNLTVTVAYRGVEGTYTTAVRVDPHSWDNTVGTATIDSHTVNQLIIDAVENPANWLGSLLSAQEGAGNSLMLLSKIDGVQDLTDLSVTFSATQNGPGGGPVAFTNLAASYSGANVQFAQVQDVTATPYQSGVNPDHTPVYSWNESLADTYSDQSGQNSLAQSDNTINLESGNDLAILGTGAHSNDKIVINNADNGEITVVNFATSGLGQDILDTSLLFTGNLVGNAVQLMPQTVAGTNMDSGLNVLNGHLADTSGPALTGAGIRYVQNAASGTPDHIASASDLLGLLQNDMNNNPQYAKVLFMVYAAGDATTTDASFDMYLATYGASGSTVEVSDLGNITFANLITDSDTNTDTGAGPLNVSTYLANASQIGINWNQLAPDATAYTANPPFDGYDLPTA